MPVDTKLADITFRPFALPEDEPIQAPTDFAKLRPVPTDDPIPVDPPTELAVTRNFVAPVATDELLDENTTATLNDV